MLLAYVVPSAAPIMTQQPQRLPSMIVEACMLTAAENPPQAPVYAAGLCCTISSTHHDTAASTLTQHDC